MAKQRLLRIKTTESAKAAAEYLIKHKLSAEETLYYWSTAFKDRGMDPQECLAVVAHMLNHEASSHKNNSSPTG